ncbi:hypothetical protein [Citrobacter portucalensis]|uniref:hypothetical protein n=1 Tax=Citrobacter portucalensis TaxID=1639133 RepID=UPI001F3C97A1|nr:hypothetical protein [Citrobacter portucalensis]
MMELNQINKNLACFQLGRIIKQKILKKMSNSNAQKSNVNILGSNNETKVNQFNISIYANDVLSITNELRENIIDTLEGELVNSELNVFLCYPNILKDKLFDSCINNLKTELSKIDAVIYEGGGKQTLPDTESVYIHIAELDFINKKCDSIIIFVLDELTLSQITLISYYKITKDIKNPDLIVICNDKIKNLDRFFSLGVLQYCDDNSIKIFDISDIEDEKIENIIRRVRNKKLVSKNKGLLGG